jgi:hypothetical protein
MSSSNEHDYPKLCRHGSLDSPPRRGNPILKAPSLVTSHGTLYKRKRAINKTGIPSSNASKDHKPRYLDDSVEKGPSGRLKH